MQRLPSLTAIATLLCASHAFAAAPTIVADAQQTIGNNLTNPHGVVVAPNGAVYVADTSDNEVVQLTTVLPGAPRSAQVATGSLTAPRGLAVDASGNLFIGDTPNLGFTARITEVLATGGVPNGQTRTIYSGGFLDDPISLAVDSADNLYIGDYSLINGGSIYVIKAGTSTPQKLTVSGIQGTFTPAALSLDGKGNLYIANSSAANGGIYVISTNGGAAAAVSTGGFVTSDPEGLAFDASGDLFILAQLNESNAPSGEQVIELPAGSASPFIMPTSNLETGGGLAVDLNGNLDVTELGANGLFGIEQGSGLVAQLDFLNPVYLGAVTLPGTGTGVVYNFAFNAVTKFTGLRAVTLGDLGSKSDVVSSTSNCATGTTSGQTAYAPYICNATFAATPQYSGTRVSAIEVEGTGSAILHSSPVYELGGAPAQIAYPLDVTMTPLGLIQPQGVAISGFDQKIYIADLAGGAVYSVAGLNGSTATAVSTGSTGVTAPSAVAIDGEGNVYVADFSGQVAVVPPTATGIHPYVLGTGGLLQHPISLALDELGDLYIGDAGSAGDDATSGAPGFVVVVPYKGSPFKLKITGASIIFPQALAFNNISGQLVIGDGGDGSSAGQIVQVAASGAATVLSVTEPAVPTNPSGLTLDAAGNLYVLDGTAGTITEVYTNGTSALLSLANTSALSYPSAMASSAGSQSLVVANLGGGAENNLVYLNGNSVTFAFGSQTNGTVSTPQTATVANIGNQTLKLSNSYLKPNPIAGFGFGTGTTCANNDTLTALTSCALAFEFEPTSKVTGSITAQVSLASNAYNSTTPEINLSGTGTAAKVQANALVAPKAAHTNQAGRKSFARAKLK